MLRRPWRAPTARQDWRAITNLVAQAHLTPELRAECKVRVKGGQPTAQPGMSARARYEAKKQQAARGMQPRIQDAEGGAATPVSDEESDDEVTEPSPYGARPLPSQADLCHDAVGARRAMIAAQLLPTPKAQWYELDLQAAASGKERMRVMDPASVREGMPPVDFAKDADYLQFMREEAVKGARPASRHYRDRQRTWFLNYRSGVFQAPKGPNKKLPEEALRKKARVQACTTIGELAALERVRQRELYDARRDTSDRNEI